MDLNRLGWNEHFEREFQPHRDKGLIPARVVTQQGSSYVLICEGEYISGRVSGKFRYNAQIKSHFPAVGDWVGVNILSDYNEAIIQVLFSRKSCFSRKVPISGGRKLKNGIIVGGSMEDQVLAANIDIVFIVNGLDGNFNLRRIERYLTLAYNCGAMPVIILNKADLCTNIEESIGSVEKIAFGVPVHAISVSTNIGMEVFNSYLSAGNTAIFIGSSGVGKSTIINYLLGEEVMKTGVTSSVTGKGRHTTTSRELLFHPAGGMVIDTPGIRELQLWGEIGEVERSFEDVVSLMSQCRFKDCTHNTEPGCAVKRALDDGTLDPERYESYKKQYGEIQRLDKMKRQIEKNFNRAAKRNMSNIRK